MLSTIKSDLQKGIPDFDRVYTIVLKNTVDNAVQVTLFGANQFLTAVNFGLPATVVVNVIESSYQELLWDTINRPFVIGGSIVDSSIPQLAQINLIRYRDSNGVIQQYTFHPANYFSVDQYQNFLELYPLDIYVTGEMQSQFLLLGNTTVTITLYVKKRITPANILHNQPVLEVGKDLSEFFVQSIRV